MTYTLTYKGGPWDGQTQEYEHLGNTWSRQTVKDENDVFIGYYFYWGPGAEPVQEWMSREEFVARERAMLDMVESAMEGPGYDADALEKHVERLIEESKK
jgi:hypothetical protein